MIKEQAVPEAEVQPEFGYEEIRVTPIKAMGRACPFRGVPFRPLLDERCPSSIQAYVLPVVDKAYGASAEYHAQLAPVVREGSYCSECLVKRVREREAGLSAGSGSFGVKQRRSRKEK